MSDIISYGDLAAAPPVGLGLAWDIAKGAQAIACPLYKQFPGFFTAEADTQLPGFNQIGAKQIMDGACGRDPGGLPTQPFNPTFSGGQCSTDYTVTLNRDVTTDPAHTETLTYTIPGPVSTSETTDSGGHKLFQLCGVYTFGPACTGIQDSDGYANTHITGVVRVDGQPDNCGNGPGGYPYPKTPPAGLTGTTGINDPNSPTPTPAPYVVVGPNNNTDNPGPPGIRVDIGGVTVNFGPIGVSLAPKIGLPAGGAPGGGAGGLTAPQAKQLGDAASGAGNRPGTQKPPSPATHTSNPQPPAPGNKKSGISALAYLHVDLNVQIQNPQIQPGDTGPDVYYHAGWIWFTIGDYLFERHPLDALHKEFVAPTGADGYAYTCQLGYTATITEITLNPS